MFKYGNCTPKYIILGNLTSNELNVLSTKYSVSYSWETSLK